ncbi:MFS transporter [Streptomyces coeruleoprunus]|uniref:MFS transporter n=1 Tax=Streptomyces coeruleoprunus TaxID=285563 RepID=A0ABV9X9W4_9ACTN
MKKRYALRSSSAPIGSYAVGAAVARTGDEMSGPALLLAGFAATGSAAAASALLAGITAAAAVGGPVFGALLDRTPRPGRLLAWALAGYAAALVVVLAGLGRLPLPVTVLIAVLAGLVGPALSGGWTAQLPRVVPKAVLPRATALDAMTFNLAGLAGPALAGAVATLYGAPAAVVVAATLVAAALPSAWALPKARPLDRAAAPAPHGTPEAASISTAPAVHDAARDARLLADLAAGFRVIARVRPLARATAASVLSCAGQGVLVACAPLLGERHLGGAGAGALLLAVLAASALAANALLSRRPDLMGPDALVRYSTLVLAVALALAATGHPVLLVAATVVAGIGEGPQLTALFAIRHRDAPERLRGQIFTTGASLKISGFAVGAAAAGPLALASLPGALLAAAALQLLAAAVTVPADGCRSARRTVRRTRPAPAARTPGTPGPADRPAPHRNAPRPKGH